MGFKELGGSKVKSFIDYTYFPVVGQRDALYMDLANSYVYAWTGVLYEQIGGGGGGSSSWGSITGTLSSQADLQTALNGKMSATITQNNFFSQYPRFPDFFNYSIDASDHYKGGYGVYVSGANAAVSALVYDTANAGVNSTEKAFGGVFFNTGTGTSAYAGAALGGGIPGAHRFGSQDMMFGTRCNLSALSDGTNTYTAHFGFMTHYLINFNNEALRFRYAHSVNSGRWQCVSTAGSTETVIDSGVAPTAGVYQVLEIKVLKSGVATFYIDGSLVGTFSSGLTTSNTFAPMIGFMDKTAGSSARFMHCDAYYLATEWLAAR